MTSINKRRSAMEDNKTQKRVKKECDYGDKCYRKNPAHFREFSHPHLEAILDSHDGSGSYPIPEKYSLEKAMITEQLDVIVEKKLYEPVTKQETNSTKPSNTIQNENASCSSSSIDIKALAKERINRERMAMKNAQVKTETSERSRDIDRKPENVAECSQGKVRDSDYRPIVQPTRRIEDFIDVVRPKGGMATKHAASAPYYIFYTTITAAKETHSQPYSITFQEILDHSLGELKCSLQINFMVEIGWLLAQYYFAGYSEKKLTILYGEDMPELKNINKKKPNVDAHLVTMATPFGKHHTKMMLLCYEDGSLRVVVSTANLYMDDWENRTQGLWLSPRCPELPAEAMPFEGDSPTAFKKSLLRYMNHYQMPQLAYYVDRVKRCDFSHINVFLVASAPGSHFDMDWALTRVGTLLRQHCCIPPEEQRQWPLLAQASSLGTYGKQPQLWLTGDFLHHFIKIKNQSQMLSTPPDLKIIYPSLENVKKSHDGLLGGGCLPYAAEAHSKQPWLNNYLYYGLALWPQSHLMLSDVMAQELPEHAFSQWKASSTCRDKAMPHIKSYTRISKDNRSAAFYLLTSGNVSKAAWGSINKSNGALRIMSYEAGVLFLPRFIINKDFFDLDERSKDRLVLPYDVPPTKYTSDMSPWVSDYLM